MGKVANLHSNLLVLIVIRSIVKLQFLQSLRPTLTVAHNAAETIGEKAHDARLSAQYAAHVTKETAQDVAKNVQEKAQSVSSAVQHKAQDIKDTLYKKAIQVEAAILAAQNKNLHKEVDKANKEIDRLRNENQHITGELEVTQRNAQIACDKVNDVDQELHKIDRVIHAQQIQMVEWLMLLIP